jgi:hypothetical protein
VVDCPSGTVDCDGACVMTSNNSAHCGGCNRACTAAQECRSSQCRCRSTSTTCGTACVVLNSDPNHCGMCNRACAPGQTCVQSRCEGNSNPPDAGSDARDAGTPDTALAFTPD